MKRLSRDITAVLPLPLLIISILFTLPAANGAGDWQNKVDPWVLKTAVSQPQTEFLIYLTDQADLSGAQALKSKAERGAYVVEQLTAVAAQSQSDLIKTLAAAGVDYKSYWITNMIWVRGDAALIENLANRPDVAHIYANPSVKSVIPETDNPADFQKALDAIEWNIDKVSAPAVWDAGFTGQGVVIGGQDTGYDWDHPALINQYRGWDGSTADHNYNWHDAIHEPGSDCGANSPVPCDDNSHGTHTMGTMVGDDGGDNQIGMAPGARWIGCRNMNEGYGTPATYAECYQWFIAPTDLNDANPDPAKAPHVINNSWSCPVSEGCTDPNVLLTVVENVRAAGIVTVHSAGNSGYNGCSSIDTPAAIYDASFTVGSTDLYDNIAGSSSRGPVLVDSSGRLKPDISAPGVSIRSSLPGSGYGWKSGTSMSAPHVAGLAALLLSARPDMAGQVDEIEAAITGTAVPRTTTQTCGDVPGSEIPNNTYGWGRIDAWSAFIEVANLQLNLTKQAEVVNISPGDWLTYTLTVQPTTIQTADFQGTATAVSQLILTDTIPTGTTLVTATLPFTLENGVVSWTRDNLAVDEEWPVQLVVEVPEDTTESVVENAEYGAVGEGVTAVTGPPVITPINTPYLYYFPFFPVNKEIVEP